MNRTLHLALLTALAAAVGCAPPVPQRLDPYADLAEPARVSPYRHLKAAVVISANTKTAYQYALQVRKKMASVVQLDMEKVFADFSAPIQRNFASAAKVDTFEEAAAGGADLVALLDVFAELSRSNIGRQKFTASLILLSPGKEEIDVINGEGTGKGHFDFAGESTGPAVQEAAATARKMLEDGLMASRKLAEFAKTKAPAPAARPESIAAPALRSSDVDRPDYGLPEDPDKFAMVVGVEKYSEVPEAQFAERDAAAVKRHLLALGYPERNILHITGQAASLGGLAKNLESWLPRNVGEGSTVFFYFSGHGAPDTRSGQAYLLPWDADPQSLEHTAYPLKRLYERLNALPAKKIIVALDSCFSGAGGRSLLPKGARPLVTKVDLAAESSGRITVFTATAAHEITGSEDLQGHGLFTYWFLKGLGERKGAGTVQELYDYLLPKVKDAARRANRDQTPQLSAPSAGLPLR